MQPLIEPPDVKKGPPVVLRLRRASHGRRVRGVLSPDEDRTHG